MDGSLIGGEQCAAQADGNGARCDCNRTKNEIHDNHLHPNGLDRVDAGKDEAGHRAGQEDDSHRLGGFDLRDECRLQSGTEVRPEGILRQEPERKADFDERTLFFELSNDPGGNQHGRCHRIADHHSGERDERPRFKRDHSQSEQQAEDDQRRDAERDKGEPANARDLRGTTSDHIRSEREHEEDPRERPPQRPTRLEQKRKDNTNDQELDESSNRCPEDLSFEAKLLPD